MEIPVAPVKRVIQNAGAERVADPAAEELRDHLEAYAAEIAQRANKYALHAGRKTIKKEDIQAAVE